MSSVGPSHRVVGLVSGRVSQGAAGALAVGLTVVAVAALWRLADGAALAAGVRTAVTDVPGLVVATAALLGAFSARALAWSRTLPALSVGQSLAAVHVALGANHVLPFRLGEPLRVVSAVRRTPVLLGPATSTTVMLRATDVVTLVLLGGLVAPATLGSLLGPWGLAAAGVAGAAGSTALVVMVRQRRRAADLRLPDPLTLTLVAGAWVLEAFVVWRWATWFDLGIDPAEAMLVLCVAIAAQVVAITPAGIGTYEAAAAAALVAVGAPASAAVSTALALHGFKTVYSLVAGAIGVLAPRPGLLGRIRLPADGDRGAVPSRPVSRLMSRPVSRHVPGSGSEPVSEPGDRHTGSPDAPVVLFLPARDEAPRIRDVVARAPATVRGRPVEVVVVDDGSRDGTGATAAAAGAVVVRHATARGLGAAVRTGLSVAVDRGAAAVAFCDADGEYDPAELDGLVAPVLDGELDYVVGSRFAGRIERMHPHRRLGNRVLTRAVRFVTRTPISDGQSGFRALSARAAAAAEIAHDYNYAQVLTIDLIGKGFRYGEVPISYAFRSTGRSFVRLGTYLRHVVPTVWRQLNPGRPPDVPRTEEEPPSCDVPSGPAPSPALSR